MITTIKDSNQALYKALWVEASNYLLGFKAIKVFDTAVNTYYYKPDADIFSFVAIENITDRDKFAQAFKEHNNQLFVYINNIDPAESGFCTSLIETEEPVGYSAGADFLGITTLEEYFSWLGTLSKLPDEVYAKKYTRLPLDEPALTINANTRAITLPNDFRKNGIAVQGDDLAEVIYFEIDRYFDAMDFNNCEIFIQWELPKTKQKGVSPAYSKDISTETGKLIFGWAISQEITKVAGSLKFSVQFYQPDDVEHPTKILYSFNTLPITATIQTGMGLDLTDKESYQVDDIGGRLLERLKDSELAGGYAAAEPVFYINLLEDPYDLTVDEDGDYAYSLAVAAKTSDAGGLSYSWKYYDFGEDGEIDYNTGAAVASKDIYIIDEAPSADKGINYYYLSNGVYVRTNDLNMEGIHDYYYKANECVATKAGAYQAEAKNRITNAVTVADSKKAVFPLPVEPVIESNLPESAILENAQSSLSVGIKAIDKNEPSYQWYKCKVITKDVASQAVYTKLDGETEATLNVTEEGRYKVEVAHTRNQETKKVMSSIARVTKAAQASILTLNAEELDEDLVEAGATLDLTISNVSSDSMDIEWFVREDKKATSILKKTVVGIWKDSFDFTANKEVIFEATGDNDYIAEYYVVVTNHYNGTEAVATSDICRVIDSTPVTPIVEDDE